MATIKICTDIVQSKKLAEILPIESADMEYLSIKENGLLIGNVPFVKDDSEVEDSAYSHTYDRIACWGLAALLNVLPPYLFEFERGVDLNVYPSLNGKRWHCSYMSNCTENVKKDKFKLITSEDNLVDACYEMILKLHELKML